ncbi:hypothetical protein B0H14DRAFT_2585705 [Mycena olivaceomarginata]|nr:hypothetical protein B0H14DRAFT_2585705 [Mycena olivaceomarginata]
MPGRWAPSSRSTCPMIHIREVGEGPVVHLPDDAHQGGGRGYPHQEDRAHHDSHQGGNDMPDAGFHRLVINTRLGITKRKSLSELGITDWCPPSVHHSADIKEHLHQHPSVPGLLSATPSEGEGGRKSFHVYEDCDSKVMMPKYEILHSGQYWQDIRRRAKETKAAHAEREARAPSIAPTLGDSGHVFTFVPGRRQPYTGLVQTSGKIVAVPNPKSTSQEQARVAQLAAKHKERRQAAEADRVARANRLQQQTKDADSALLARLNWGKRQRDSEASATGSKKRKLSCTAPCTIHHKKRHPKKIRLLSTKNMIFKVQKPGRFYREADRDETTMVAVEVARGPGQSSPQGEKAEWLNTFRDQLRDAGKDPGSVYTDTTNAFITRYRDPESKPPVILPTTDEEEKARRGSIQQKLRIVHSAAIAGILGTMQTMSGPGSRPQCKPNLAVYLKLHYASRVKPQFDLVWADAKKTVPWTERVAMSQDYARTCWEKESPQFRAEVEEAGIAMHQADMEEWKASRKSPEGSAEEYHKYVTREERREIDQLSSSAMESLNEVVFSLKLAIYEHRERGHNLTTRASQRWKIPSRAMAMPHSAKLSAEGALGASRGWHTVFTGWAAVDGPGHSTDHDPRRSCHARFTHHPVPANTAPTPTPVLSPSPSRPSSPPRSPPPCPSSKSLKTALTVWGDYHIGSDFGDQLFDWWKDLGAADRWTGVGANKLWQLMVEDITWVLKDVLTQDRAAVEEWQAEESHRAEGDGGQ